MEETRIESEEQNSSGGHGRWLTVLVVVLFIAVAIGFGYGLQQRQAVQQMVAHEDETNATVNQLRSQLDTVNAKLAEMTTPPPEAASTGGAPAGPPGTRAARGRGTGDRRLKQIQAQLAEHKKQLEATQQEVESTRADLEGKLSSTKDELSGSIARTHQELVVLQKRGERNYFEFDLSKSKNFERVGPISLSLRKADTKHQSYDAMLLVDDFRLTKKKVNLYEPVWINQSDFPQPLQLVVNRIEKNRVHGYLSAPKYKLSELATNIQPENPATGQANQPANPRQQPQPSQQEQSRPPQPPDPHL